MREVETEVQGNESLRKRIQPQRKRKKRENEARNRRTGNVIRVDKKGVEHQKKIRMTENQKTEEIKERIREGSTEVKVKVMRK
jgi:hypothetical protein